MLPGDQAHCGLDVLPQFINRAGLARIVASDSQAASERGTRTFKAPDIITLPAMNGDRHLGDGGEHLLDIDTYGGITLDRFIEISSGHKTYFDWTSLSS